MQSARSRLSILFKYAGDTTRLQRCQRWNPTISSFNQSYSTEAAISTPPSERGAKSYPPKIQQIVDDISHLTLIEVADLNELLKRTLNIADTPMMSMGAMAAMAAPAADPLEVEEVAEKKVEKMAYTLKLVKFDESKKVALIKKMKNLIEGMNLVQAKKFVEGVPQTVKADIPKAEAEELQKQIEEAGGVAEIA